MSSDSLKQLAQALGQQPFADWHPPVMAFLWSIGITLTGKVAFLMVMQQVMLWGGLLVFAIYVYKQTKSRLISLLPLLIGVTPFVANISGVVWKDVHMAFALLIATVLSLGLKNQTKAMKTSIAILIALSLIYAIMLRYNAILAVIPIALYASSRIFSKKIVTVISSISIVLAAALVSAGLSIVLNVKEANPTSTVMLDDIVHTLKQEELSAASNTPDELKLTLLNIQSKCALGDIPFHSYGLCSTLDQRDIIQYKYYDELKRLWADTVTNHLDSYALYRAETFWIFLTTPAQYEYTQHSTIDSNAFGLSTHNVFLSDTLSRYVTFFTKDMGFLFRPYFWLMLSIAIMVYASKRLKRYKGIVICLAVSSVAYIVGYIPVVIGCDFRYIYWSVIAMSVCIILLATEQYMKKHKLGAH